MLPDLQLYIKLFAGNQDEGRNKDKLLIMTIDKCKTHCSR